MKKKLKEIIPEMKFNPGLLKYEPVLPLKKHGGRLKIEANWIYIILLILAMIGFAFWPSLYDDYI